MPEMLTKFYFNATAGHFVKVLNKRYFKWNAKNKKQIRYWQYGIVNPSKYDEGKIFLIPAKYVDKYFVPVDSQMMDMLYNG